MRQLYKDLDRVADVKQKRLECIGHVVRLGNGRVVKNI